LLEINKIHNADFREVANLIEDNSIDCSIVDPPFSGNSNKTNTGTRLNQNNGNYIDYDDMSERIFLKFMEPIFKDIYKKLKIGSHIYCFTDWKQLRNLMDLMEMCSFKLCNLITWDKKHFGMGKGYRQQSEFIIVASKGINKAFNLLNVGTVISSARLHKKSHPHEKPDDLIETLILNSTIEHDTVLDPFSGSGVVAAVCKKNKRNFIATEINKEFAELANSRVSNIIL